MSNSKLLSNVASNLANSSGKILTVANGKIVWSQNYAFDTANNASSNTIIIQGINDTQNTNISSAFVQANTGVDQAQAAFSKANSSITLGSTPVYLGSTNTSISGLTLTNPVIDGFTGNTGIINIGSGQIYKDVSGNFGIGTSSLSSLARLTVYSADTPSSSEYTLWLKGGSAGVGNDGGGIAFSVAGTSAIANPSLSATAIRSLNSYASESNGEQGDLAFYTNQRTGTNTYTGLTERLRITSSGNVWIGTSSGIGTSAARLQILQSGNAGLSVATSTTPMTGSSFVGWDGWAYDGSNYFAAATINFRADENWSSTNHGSVIQFRTTSSGSGGTLSEKMRIDNAGNVGIGESSPASWGKLAIYDGAAPTGTYLSVKGGYPGYAGSYGYGIKVYDKDNTTPYFSLASDYSLTINRFSNAGVYTTSLKLDSAGNLGIGTNSPAQKLEIRGNGGGDTVTLQLTNDGSHPARVRLHSGHGNWSVGNSITVGDALEFRDESAGVTRALIDSSGRIGINTTDNSNGFLNLWSGNSTTEPRASIVINRPYNIHPGNVTNLRGIECSVAGSTQTDNFTSAAIYATSSAGKCQSIYGKLNSDPSALCYGMVSDANHPDTNGYGTTTAFISRLTVGNTVGNGWVRGIEISLPNYVNSDGILFNSSYTGALTQFILRVNRNGSNIGNITCSTTATAYATSSDYRLKENIQPIQNALSRVSLLKPSKYTWKSDQSESEGFIAHELQEVVPQAVSGEKDGEQMQGVDYGKLTPLLAAAIKELNEKYESTIQELTQRIKQLEGK